MWLPNRDMIDGLNNWMDEKGFQTMDEIVGKAIRPTQNGAT